MKEILLTMPTDDEFSLLLQAEELGGTSGESQSATEPATPGVGDVLPSEVPILPLQDLVVFPVAVFPLAVSEARAVRLIDDAVVGSRLIGLVTMRPQGEGAQAENLAGADVSRVVLTDQLYQVGTLATVHKLLKLPDGSVRIAVQGLDLIRVLEYVATEPYLRARIERAPDVIDD